VEAVGQRRADGSLRWLDEPERKKQRNHKGHPSASLKGRLRYTKETLSTTHWVSTREKKHRKK
jgi:hypothetical protein